VDDSGQCNPSSSTLSWKGVPALPMQAMVSQPSVTGVPAPPRMTTLMKAAPSARKLLVLANALLKANRPWTPKTASSIRILLSAPASK
jgi:hypothetical protein